MQWGDGKPLIILHGLFGMADNWAPIARRLAASYRVIVPDLRNHGRSIHTTEHSYDSMASDIVGLCHSLKITRTIVLGHSMGGKVAMTLAHQHPSLVERLIVADIGPGAYPNHTHHLQLIEAMMDAHPETASNRSEIDSRLAQQIHDERIRLFLLKNITRNQSGRFAWKTNLPVLLQSMNEIVSEVASKGVFTAKTLFIKGELSDYITDNQCQLIFERFPTATVTTLEKAGHWLHADAAEEFYSTVKNFLDS